MNRIDALTRIEDAGNTIITGALMRQADALIDARIRSRVPLLAMALPHVGHYQTRNRGTLGGSVAHADPSAEIRWRWQRSMARSICAPDTARGACAPLTSSDPLSLPPVRRMRCSLPCAGRRRATACATAFEEFSVRGGDYAIVAVALRGRVRREWLSRPRTARFWRLRRDTPSDRA